MARASSDPIPYGLHAHETAHLNWIDRVTKTTRETFLFTELLYYFVATWSMVFILLPKRAHSLAKRHGMIGRWSPKHPNTIFSKKAKPSKKELLGFLTVDSLARFHGKYT